MADRFVSASGAVFDGKIDKIRLNRELLQFSAQLTRSPAVVHKPTVSIFR